MFITVNYLMATRWKSAPVKYFFPFNYRYVIDYYNTYFIFLYYYITVPETWLLYDVLNQYSRVIPRPLLSLFLFCDNLSTHYTNDYSFIAVFYTYLDALIFALESWNTFRETQNFILMNFPDIYIYTYIYAYFFVFPHLRNVYLVLNLCGQTSNILTTASFCHCNVNVATSEDMIEQVNTLMIKWVDLLLNPYRTNVENRVSS